MKKRLLIIVLASVIFLSGCVSGGSGGGYRLNIQIEGQGRVLGAASRYSPDSLASLTVIPAQGWVFTGWAGDAENILGPLGGVYQLVMDGDRSLTAIFTKSSATENVKVLYWNIQHGKGLDGVVDLDRIAGEILASAADIVVLSELDVNRSRSGYQNQPKILQEKTGFPYMVFHPSTSGLVWQYGNMILSKYPILEDFGYELPNPQGGEKRKVVAAKVQVGTEDLVVYGTHLSVITAERDDQIQAIVNLAKGERAPVVLCGDFNAEPDSLNILNLTSQGFVDTYPLFNTDFGFTYPADKPSARIDYIFVQQHLENQLASSKIIRTDASDHFGVFTTIELPQS